MTGRRAASTDAIDTTTIAFHYDGNGCRVTTVGVANLVIFGVLEENEERENISTKAYKQRPLRKTILAEGAIARSMTLCGGVLFAS